jgi:late competence protein required for DNA uptake (superfamily II DNA/RNA helicase)
VHTQTVAMTGSMPGGPNGLDRIKKVFGLQHDNCKELIYSPFRTEIQQLIICTKTFLSSKGARTRRNILDNFTIENIFRAHVQSILLGSGMVVMTTTEAEVEMFIDSYSKYCPKKSIGVLLGTRKMSIKKINRVLKHFRSGKITLLVTTSILCMGINLSCHNIVVLGVWSYYQYIQSIGRLQRGTVSQTDSGMALLIYSPNDFDSDFKNARYHR